MSLNLSYAVARYVNVNTPNQSPVLRRRLHLRYSYDVNITYIVKAHRGGNYVPKLSEGGQIVLMQILVVYQFYYMALYHSQT